MIARRALCRLSPHSACVRITQHILVSCAVTCHESAAVAAVSMLVAILVTAPSLLVTAPRLLVTAPRLLVARSPPCLAARAVAPMLSIKEDEPSSRVKEDEPSSRAPSMSEIISFSVPLLGIGLASPVLGLIDSAVVGRYAGSLQLAALAPAVALCDIIAYLFRGLGSATTHFVATALADGDASGERRAVRNAITFALFWGVAAGALQFFGCPPMLRLLSGGASHTYPLADACAYARVRAIGLPFALVFMVLQAAFLGARDWRPPTIAALVAFIANFVADIILVAWCHLGVLGAAIGTVIAQIGAAATLLITRARRERAATTSAPPADATPPAGRWPTRAERSEWAAFSIPLAVGQVTRCLTFSQVTATATAGGAVGSAATRCSKTGTTVHAQVVPRRAEHCLQVGATRGV